MTTIMKCMATGLALIAAFAMPAYASPVLPGTLGDNFAVLNSGPVTFSGAAELSAAGTTIGVGAVEYLVVGGGGAGGRTDGYSNGGGGGGGAGGLVEGMFGLATQDQYTVTVGAGGAIGSTNASHGGKGANSVFAGITGLGGGGGSHGGTTTSQDGGSSGGHRLNNDTRQALQPTSQWGGLGNAGRGNSSNGNAGGGGGGAGTAATAASGNNGGNGGAGVARSITGTSLFYAGGGGGGANGTSTAGTGGSGVGGNGSNSSAAAGAGVANTGSGGGGGNNNSSSRAGAGGSGVVHVRYAGDYAAASGGTTGRIGDTYTLHSFTATGSTLFELNQGVDLSNQMAILSGELWGTGGLTVAGPGTLILTGDNSYTGATNVNAGTLRVNGTHANGGDFTVAAGAAIGGYGLIDSALTLNDGANFWWDGASTLTVAAGKAVSLESTFGVDSLTGFEWANVAVGKYTLIDNNSSFSAMNLNHWGAANAYELEDGRYAYFSAGSLVLNVVPEPTAWLLFLIAAACGLLVRRRK